MADLLVDNREATVRFLLVEHGGFLGFDQTTLIPLDAVTKVTEDEVFIDQSRERVASAPGYTPDLVDDRRYHSGVYSRFGYSPYWSQGYDYPGGRFRCRLRAHGTEARVPPSLEPSPARRVAAADAVSTFATAGGARVTAGGTPDLPDSGSA